jgi:hypothetical protein
MKRNLNVTLWSLILAPAMMLVACQKNSSDMSGQSTMATYIANLSAANTPAGGGQNRAIISGDQGSALGYGDIFGNNIGNWNPFGGSPYGGFYIQQQTTDTVATCIQLVQGIPRTAGNFQLMVGELARCLNTQVQYMNPIFTAGYRGLDNGSQEMWRYGLDGLRPGCFGSYGGQYSMYSDFASNGFVSSDLSGNGWMGH